MFAIASQSRVGRDKVLVSVGLLNLAVLAFILVIAPFDERSVMGLNPWIKPMKFASSIALYAFTVAWLLSYVPGPRRAIRTVRWSIAIAMLVEIVCIVVQAARGTTSHFNVVTRFDETIFNVMGGMIFVNTLAAALLLVLFLRPLPLPRGYLWGIRLGLMVFILASLEGAVMIVHRAHTVGAADGGPGLPFVNWSTQAGDLRVAHFLGLHSLQLLPLAGYLLSRRLPESPRLQVLAVAALAAGWLGLMVIVFVQAVAGRPFVPLG